MQERPNIIYVLADDMGYGDMGCNNPDSKIPTPNLDRLAASGMRFTDAHAGSSVCTPSRYNLLTGRYCWRSRLKSFVLMHWDSALIEEDRLTVAGLLKGQGYSTHCIGKWHLGWNWETVDGELAGEQVPFAVHSRESLELRAEIGKRIDYSKRIGGGPLDHGFDTYFGVDVPNFPPYTWFEDDHLTDAPTVEKPAEIYGNAGLMKPGWSHEDMLPEFARRAVSVIEKEDDPFFLYFPLTAPHAPICPNDTFKGKSGAGKYGDFVCEIDWIIGELLDALERTGKRENTLVIFTSDNGPAAVDERGDHVYELAETMGHYCMGHLRGKKRDVWEGGHREPFVASWPAVVPAGTTCDQLVCLGDLMATCAELTGCELPEGAGEDSVSMLPLLKGEHGTPTRQSLVMHGCDGRFAVRKDEFVFIDAPSGLDAWHGCIDEEPEWFKRERGYVDHNLPGELFNVAADISERENLYGTHPEKVKELSVLLEQIKADSSSAPDAEGV